VIENAKMMDKLIEFYEAAHQTEMTLKSKYKVKCSLSIMLNHIHFAGMKETQCLTHLQVLMPETLFLLWPPLHSWEWSLGICTAVSLPRSNPTSQANKKINKNKNIIVTNNKKMSKGSKGSYGLLAASC
jgi:hypothetical protein